MGCTSDPVTPIPGKDTDRLSQSPLSTQPYSTQTSGLSADPLPERPCSSKATPREVRGTTGGRHAAREKEAASHCKPPFPDYPWTAIGKAGQLPLSPPSRSDSSDNGALSSLHVLSVGRELLFSGLVTIFPCHSLNKASGAWGVTATLEESSIFYL